MGVSGEAARDYIINGRGGPQRQKIVSKESEKVRCTRCLYDETTSSIQFDEHGVCNYCKLHDQMEAEYATGAEGERRLQMLADEIKKEGKGKPFDCVVGVSGGCDSSYLLHKAVEMGLRPLAAHFDNTWNSAIATSNIHRMLNKLKLELFTIVVDNKEYDDIYRSFFLAQVPDLEAPTDIGLAAVLYKACSKFKIKTILEGHSFRTEGVSPLGWHYMDGKYIESVHQKFGRLPMKTYPNMKLGPFLKWILIDRYRKVRPLYFMDYQKEPTKKFLNAEYGWEWYGGHHLENRITAFYHTYFLPRRRKIDTRLLGYAALVRSGQMNRSEGLELLATPQVCDPEIVKMVKVRLGFSDEEFERLMNAPLKTYRDYKTYKPTFERMRPFFYVMQKFDLVPKSFYVKYTSKNEI